MTKVIAAPYCRGARVSVRDRGLGSVRYAVKSSDGKHWLRISVLLDDDRRYEGYAGRVFDAERVSLIVTGDPYCECLAGDCPNITTVATDGSPRLCAECKVLGTRKEEAA